MLGVWLRTFAHDGKVHVLLLLIVIDFILGVIAAFNVGTFRFSYVSDFLRNDILFKIIPYFTVYAASIVAGGVDIVIPGLDFGFISDSVFSLIVVALVGSIFSSLADLHLFKVPAAIGGSENTGPPRS